MNVRAVNGHVTRRTALIARVDHAVGIVFGIRDPPVEPDAEVAGTGVTLQAERGRGWTREQLRVGGTMRLVAGDAAIHLPRLVFVEERTALVHVALETGLLV